MHLSIRNMISFLAVKGSSQRAEEYSVNNFYSVCPNKLRNEIASSAPISKMGILTRAVQTDSHVLVALGLTVVRPPRIETYSGGPTRKTQALLCVGVYRPYPHLERSDLVQLPPLLHMTLKELRPRDMRLVVRRRRAGFRSRNWVSR